MYAPQPVRNPVKASTPRAKPDARPMRLALSGGGIAVLSALAAAIVLPPQQSAPIVTDQQQKDFTFATVSVQQMAKIGDKWKVGDSKNYDPAWENDSQPEPTVQR